MTRRWNRWLAAAAALCAGLAVSERARALDSPHDLANNPTLSCKDCHVTHNAPGAVLSNVFGNSNLCFSCHNAPGVGMWRNWPWTNEDQAVPTAGGTSHRWESSAVNPLRGARLPVGPMAYALDSDGGLMCSTCHDQHAGASKNAPGSTLHVFNKDGRLVPPAALVRTAGAGTGTLTLSSVVGATLARAGARPRSYSVQIVTGGAVGAATYRVSYDNGRSWSVPAATGASVVFDSDASGSTVVMAFSGNFVGGATPDTWKPFTVTYPMLRVSNVDDAMCENCHRERVASAACVEGDPGAVNGAGESCDTGAGILYSHPSGPGVTLAKSYDRASGGVPAVRHVDGTTQGAGAGPNASAKLHFDASNQVRCTTCHAVHNADSSSLTEDVR
jgi:predicted CXXCH cytochrome family protein